jgi:hypothetical protein
MATPCFSTELAPHDLLLLPLMTALADRVEIDASIRAIVAAMADSRGIRLPYPPVQDAEFVS